MEVPTPLQESETGDFTSLDTTLRLYAIVRRDLQMSTGKLAAQAGHAFLNSFLESEKHRPMVNKLYQENGLGTKICLGVDNLEHLLMLYTYAKSLNLACCIIEDSGHIMPPFFDGNPIVTALGIGPCFRHEIEILTKDLKLI